MAFPVPRKRTEEGILRPDLRPDLKEDLLPRILETLLVILEVEAQEGTSESVRS